MEENGIVRFPDAPSDRAVKHVRELKKAVEEGYEAYVFFVVQMKGVRYFTPNIDTHSCGCGGFKRGGRRRGADPCVRLSCGKGRDRGCRSGRGSFRIPGIV